MLSDESRQLARAAARWLVLLDSGELSAAQQAELTQWRGLSSRHEQAWQKAQALRQRFTALPSELAMASLDRPQYPRRQLLKGALGLAIAAPLAWQLSRERPLQAWHADLATGTGERRRVTLADGSQLQLNTASAVDLDPAQQRLRLIRGEIALQRRATTPLRLSFEYGEASLLDGDICARLDGDHCELSVFAGRLEVRPPGQAPLVLEAGQRLRLSARGSMALPGFDVQQPGWRDGVIVANDQPLGDFLRELERYRPGLLRWDVSLEALRVTGSFRLDDTDRILQLLAASLPLQVRTRTRYWVTLVPRDGHPSFG